MYQGLIWDHRMELYVNERIALDHNKNIKKYGVEAQIVGRCKPSKEKKLA